jgi:hypothetical protein
VCPRHKQSWHSDSGLEPRELELKDAPEGHVIQTVPAGTFRELASCLGPKGENYFLVTIGTATGWIHPTALEVVE